MKILIIAICVYISFGAVKTPMNHQRMELLYYDENNIEVFRVTRSFVGNLYVDSIQNKGGTLFIDTFLVSGGEWKLIKDGRELPYFSANDLLNGKPVVSYSWHGKEKYTYNLKELESKYFGLRVYNLYWFYFDLTGEKLVGTVKFSESLGPLYFGYLDNSEVKLRIINFKD